MKKIVYTSSIEIECAVPFGRTKFARNLFGGIGGMAGGGFGVAYGGFGVEAGGTAVNSHDISVTALYFSLNNFVIPEVATEHSDWTYEQQREEAVKRIEMRSADNLRKGYLPELERAAVMTTSWDVIETESGKQLATKNGDKYVTQQELWNNFEQYAKSRGEWNENLEQEKNAQLAIQTSLVDGSARGAATWLSHASNQARLLQVWERTEDGQIVSRQYDVGRIVGRDLTHREAEQVMHHVSQLYGEHASQSDAAYPHVMTTEKLQIQEVSSIVQQDAIKPEENQHALAREHYQEIPVEPVGEEKPLSDERVDSSEGGQKQVEIKGIGSRELPERKKSKQISKAMPLTYEPLTGSIKTVAQSAQVVAKDSIATAVLVGEFVIKKLQERRKKAQKAPRVSVTRLADKSSREISQNAPPHPLEKKLATFSQAVMLSVAKEIKKAVGRRKIRRKKKIDKRLFGEQLLSRVDKILLKQYFVKKEKRGAKPSRVIEMARRGFVFKKGEALVAVKETIVRVAKPVERLWKIARRLARRAERLKGQYVRTESPQAVSLRKREIVLSFSFAWSLWALLFLSRNEHKQQDPYIFIYEKTRVSKQELTESDPQPWILLAIIWHLAMIREQGVTQVTGNPSGLRVNKQQATRKKKPIKKLPAPYIPHEGVIFALAS